MQCRPSTSFIRGEGYECSFGGRSAAAEICDDYVEVELPAAMLTADTVRVEVRSASSSSWRGPTPRARATVEDIEAALQILTRYPLIGRRVEGRAGWSSPRSHATSRCIVGSKPELAWFSPSAARGKPAMPIRPPGM
jgi:hypothetical protein